MYALNEQKIIVYFGGEYTEHWTEDYHLTVSYTGRTQYTAFRKNGLWLSDSPLPDCVLAEPYFAAACDISAALSRCDELYIGLERLNETLCSDSLIAPYELLRALLDDRCCSLECAVDIVINCFDEISNSICESDLRMLQPRTADLIHVLQNELSVRVSAKHDMRRSCYRYPLGSVKTSETVTLKITDLCRNIDSASCVIYSDLSECEHPMFKDSGNFTANIRLPDEACAMWYCFRLNSKDVEYWLCPDSAGFYGITSRNRSAGFRLTVYEKDFQTPDWFKNSVMYQIFPDRFAFSKDGTAARGIEYHKSLGQTPRVHSSIADPVCYLPAEGEPDYEPDDFYGGTLNGIRNNLDYLKSLGVTVVYLNPIVEARSNHRYDTSDYMKVDPILGTNEDFSALCAEAGKVGIRIITDGVFSHTGADSIYFDKFGHYGNGACSSQSSPYYDWYNFFDYPSKYKCWWNFPDLPEVDEENQSWQNYVISDENSVIKTWLKRGSSGWRLDVADELPDDVLSLIRLSAKAENKDALILGEVWEDAVLKVSYGARRRYALGSALDSVMNYPLRTAVLNFMHGNSDAYELRDFLEGQKLNYPSPLYYSLMNLMGSHDVERLRTNLSSEVDVKSLPRNKQAEYSASPQAEEKAQKLERLCSAIQFCLPGVPSIYYGEETGMTGCSDPFNRLPFCSGNGDLVNWYITLSTLRRQHNVLSSGRAEFAACGLDVLIISRISRDESISCVINRSSIEKPVYMPVGGIELINDENVPPEFSIQPYTALIIRH